MPCSDGGPSYEQTQRDAEEHQILTRLACDRCREIEARGGLVPTWAQEWWTDHKREDAEREAQNQRAKQEAAIRRRAIAKLTPEEREELGV